jgi:hypothetical protein
LEGNGHPDETPDAAAEAFNAPKANWTGSSDLMKQ